MLNENKIKVAILGCGFFATNHIHSWKSFKDVVKRFRKKPQKPEEWAKKLQAKVHKKFSFEQIAAAYEEKFGSLL